MKIEEDQIPNGIIYLHITLFNNNPVSILIDNIKCNFTYSVSINYV